MSSNICSLRQNILSTVPFYMVSLHNFPVLKVLKVWWHWQELRWQPRTASPPSAQSLSPWKPSPRCSLSPSVSPQWRGWDHLRPWHPCNSLKGFLFFPLILILFLLVHRVKRKWSFHSFPCWAPTAFSVLLQYPRCAHRFPGRWMQWAHCLRYRQTQQKRQAASWKLTAKREHWLFCSWQRSQSKRWSLFSE